MDNRQLMVPTGYIDHTADSETINQKVKDGYINATAMYRASGKQWRDCIRLSITKLFINERQLYIILHH